MIFDWPLAVTMAIFFFFLGPAYAWGMSKVFRITGGPVLSIKNRPIYVKVKSTRIPVSPIYILVNPRPWGFLWSNASVMGILTVGSFVILVWLIRGDGLIAYQHYFDLLLAFLSALGSMWWADSKLREYDKEERDSQRECLRKALEENRLLRTVNKELAQENHELKKTNVAINIELQVALDALASITERLDGVTLLYRLYRNQFCQNQIIENNLETYTTELRN